MNLFWKLFGSKSTRGMDIHRMSGYDEPPRKPRQLTYGWFAFWLIFTGAISLVIGIGIGINLGQKWGG